MSGRTLILVPGFKGFFSPIGQVARKAVQGTTALVTFDVDRAVALYKAGRVARVVVVMGAKIAGKAVDPMYAYEYLIGKGVQTVLVDSLWRGVKEQVILRPQYLFQTVLAFCV